MSSRAFLLAASLLLLVASPASGATPGSLLRDDSPYRDDWLGRDKLLHFSLSVGLAGAGYGGGALLFDAPQARWISGAGLALGAGLGKEFYDAARGSRFSFKDLAWDALGTTTGLVVSWLIERLLFGETDARPAPVEESVRNLAGGSRILPDCARIPAVAGLGKAPP